MLYCISVISLTEVLNTLKKEGFTQVESPSDLDGYKYCLDEHCQDLLLFPTYLKEELTSMEMFIDYKTVLQVCKRLLHMELYKGKKPKL